MPNQNPLIPGILLVACTASAFAQEGPKSGSVVPVVRVDPDNGFPPLLNLKAVQTKQLFPAEFAFLGWSGDTKNSTLYAGYANWRKSRNEFYYSFGGLVGESYHFNRAPLVQAFSEALVPVIGSSSSGIWLNPYFSAFSSGDLSGWERSLQSFTRLTKPDEDGTNSSGRFISANEIWFNAGIRLIDLNQSYGSFTAYNFGLKGATGVFSSKTNESQVPRLIWSIRRGLGGSTFDFEEWAGSLSLTVGNGTQAIAAGFTSTNRFSLTYTAFTSLGKRY